MQLIFGDKECIKKMKELEIENFKKQYKNNNVLENDDEEEEIRCPYCHETTNADEWIQDQIKIYDTRLYLRVYTCPYCHKLSK